MTHPQEKVTHPQEKTIHPQEKMIQEQCFITLPLFRPIYGEMPPPNTYQGD